MAVDQEMDPRAYVPYLRHGFVDVGLSLFDGSGTSTQDRGNVYHYEER